MIQIKIDQSTFPTNNTSISSVCLVAVACVLSGADAQYYSPYGYAAAYPTAYSAAYSPYASYYGGYAGYAAAYPAYYGWGSNKVCCILLLTLQKNSPNFLQ